MNFITFPVSATNIFPVANATNGAQLLTEWNLRSREMVDTDSNIQYDIGHSFVHSMNDFAVSVLTDDAGIPVNGHSITIAEGKGIINGHFVQTLAPMTIDLVEANGILQQRSMAPLKGELAIGIRAFYATEQTVAGTILAEDNETGMYQGVQIVILPSSEFITPADSPKDITKINAHIKLATFQYISGKVANIINLKSKIQYLDAERLKNADQLLTEGFVRKTGLNSKKIYAFAGKGTNPSTGLDTWTDATDALMVWDKNPQRTTVKPAIQEAQFQVVDDSAYLVVPHLQVEGMKTDDNVPEYYASKTIELPKADFTLETPGLISKSYTSQIKAISKQINDFRTTLTGKQIYYLEVFAQGDTLPRINPAWNIGDYILVNQDTTVDDTSDGIKPPATMYVVLPGLVQSVQFLTKVDDSDDVPSQLTGAEIALLSWAEADRYDPPETEDPEFYPEFYTDDNVPRGVPHADYFRVKYIREDHTFSNYYYEVKTAGPREYSDAVFVTGEIPLAEENMIGGFLNVSSDTTDYGYVYRDDYGRLRLVDYGLLRSGTLAYQLGDDLSIPAGLNSEEIQQYITEYINNRVAFANDKKAQSTDPNVIHLYLTLPEEETQTNIEICNIDCRFNTSFCLHVLGTANKNTVINVHDCQKLKIDNGIQGSPIINVMRCSLYYDPIVLNYIASCDRGSEANLVFTGMEDIKLWYEMFDAADPNLIVNDMTVTEVNAPVSPTEVDYWSAVGAESNDNYYLAALKSITFAGNGTIIGCQMLVANQSTSNVVPGDSIVVADFELPQGTGLTYPKACMTKQMKVTGSFVSAYLSAGEWYTTNTLFSALTQAYDEYDMSVTTKGNIAFHSTTVLIPTTIAQTSIPAWETDTYHLFTGGVI